jgi:hypothetical protein
MRAPFRRDLAESDRTPNIFGPDQPRDRPAPAPALIPADPNLSTLEADDDTEDLYLDLGVGD